MPCAKGMLGCKTGCLHKQMVEEYHLSRYTEEQAMEAVTSDWKTDNEMYIERHGPFIDFKRWLKGRKEDHD